jgi:hypothetical protein
MVQRLHGRGRPGALIRPGIGSPNRPASAAASGGGPALFEHCHLRVGGTCLCHADRVSGRAAWQAALRRAHRRPSADRPRSARCYPGGARCSQGAARRSAGEEPWCANGEGRSSACGVACVLFPPFRAGTTHVMQLGPVRIEHPAPSPRDRVEAGRRRPGRKQHPQDIRI